MRLRNVKYAKELIQSYPDYMILKPKSHKGKWQSLFENDHPIEVEVGCGKGKFVYEKSYNNQKKNYIGIEKYDSVIVRALEKLILEPLDNIKLIRMDANHIKDIFSEGEVDHLYLNFSDPWPKRRHEKRRLTSPRFLKRYDYILKEEAYIELKTDNYGLFEYSMMSFNQSEMFKIVDISLDIYQDLPDDNVQTEFEMKFVEENKPIYYIKAIHTRSGK